MGPCYHLDQVGGWCLGEASWLSAKVQEGEPTPPSQMQIYFNSPATPDDSRPIPGGSSFSIVGSDEAGSCRGKQKKSEDDDGDLEEGHALPPTTWWVPSRTFHEY